MGVMADRLNALVIRASTPDGRVEGVYSVTDGPRLRFAPGSFGSYRENDLSQQLSRLCLRLWTGYQRAFDSTVADVTGKDVRDVSRNKETWDANRRRFREEQAITESEGMSPHGWVYIRATGMVHWQVVIRDGSLAKLDEEEFSAEALGAFESLMGAYRCTMSELRAKHYGVRWSIQKSKG